MAAKKKPLDEVAAQIPEPAMVIESLTPPASRATVKMLTAGAAGVPDLIKALRNEGVAIILISTEPETVLAESDRILVMSKGQITKELVGERVSKDLLMSYA